MVGGGGVVEVGTGEEVADAGVEVEGVAIVVVAELVDIFLGDGEVAAVAGECATEVHEELGGELVVPAKAAHDVAPAVAEAGILGVVVAVDEFEAGVKCVVAHVVGGVETAAVAEAVGDFGVDIIEVVAGIDFGGAAFGQAFHAGGHGEDGLDEDVAVGAAGRDGEGGLLFDDGAFEVGFGGDEADADAAVEFFVVAVVGGDVEDGGETAAETGREAAFVELDVLDGVGVEGGEEAAEVVDVVHGHAVKEEEVLVGAAAADVHAGHALAAVLDTGQELDGFDHVGLAKEHGDGLDLLDGDFNYTGLRTFDMLGALAGDFDFGEGGGAVELDIETVVAVELEVEELGLATHKGDTDDGMAVAQGEGVAAMLVGDGAFVGEGVEDGGADEGLAGAGVDDGAGDGEGRLFL